MVLSDVANAKNGGIILLARLQELDNELPVLLMERPLATSHAIRSHEGSLRFSRNPAARSAYQPTATCSRKRHCIVET